MLYSGMLRLRVLAALGLAVLMCAGCAGQPSSTPATKSSTLVAPPTARSAAPALTTSRPVATVTSRPVAVTQAKPDALAPLCAKHCPGLIRASKLPLCDSAGGECRLQIAQVYGEVMLLRADMTAMGVAAGDHALVDESLATVEEAMSQKDLADCEAPTADYLLACGDGHSPRN